MDEIKTQPCRICKQQKPLTREFWYVNKAMKSGLDRRCKACDNKRVDRRKSAKLNGTKNIPCADCQGRFPACAMSFDHRPGEEKVMEFNNKGKTWGTNFEAEAKKCDVVCLNCHAVRTWERRMGMKAQIFVSLDHPVPKAA